jgi:hypothetical protein
MQTTAPDRDDCLADVTCLTAEETGLHDLSALWLDLGGSD